MHTHNRLHWLSALLGELIVKIVKTRHEPTLANPGLITLGELGSGKPSVTPASLLLHRLAVRNVASRRKLALFCVCSLEQALN